MEIDYGDLGPAKYARVKYDSWLPEIRDQRPYLRPILMFLLCRGVEMGAVRRGAGGGCDDR